MQNIEKNLFKCLGYFAGNGSINFMVPDRQLSNKTADTLPMGGGYGL